MYTNIYEQGKNFDGFPYFTRGVSVGDVSIFSEFLMMWKIKLFAYIILCLNMGNF